MASIPPPIRALIVDDEPLGRERLRTLLRDADGIQVVGECEDGRAAVDAIRREGPDLVFLDVQMPELDGFGVVREVGASAMPPVIFVTAFDRYAIDAFSVHALDYLLKPFDVERFSEALERAVHVIRRNRGDGIDRRLSGLLEHLNAHPRRPSRILVKTHQRVYFIRTEDIDWIEAAGNYVRLHAGDKVHLLRQTMTALEEQLDPERFLRIHRSHIVNVDRVRELQKMFNGEYEVLLEDGTRLTLSRGYRSQLDRFGT